jgi:hypothetical protein
VTAPAVVRRWNDPPPVRVGRTTADPAVAADLGRPAGGAVGGRIREHLLRLRRAAPLGALLLTGLVAHVGLAPHLAVGGAAPDVVLVAAAAVALGCGSRTGAGFGFAAGLGADLFLTTPLGTSALAYTVVGHALGRSGRPRPSRSAAALCRPDSSCFACRSGRLHGAEPPTEAAGHSSRLRRRAAARRAALRRSILLTALAVAAGRLATAVVATTLGGVPFPGLPGLAHMAGVTVLSTPLGPVAGAAVQRLRRTTGAAG